MPTKAGTTPDWQDLEKQAYHACREWPIWLMLRTRELEEHLRKEPSKSHPPAPARSGTQPVQKRGS
jgi:hypothetical protein